MAAGCHVGFSSMYSCSYLSLLTPTQKLFMLFPKLSGPGDSESLETRENIRRAEALGGIQRVSLQ
jgi:hypothetical protein